MPNRLHSSADVPEYATYPEEPRIAAPALPLTSDRMPEREWEPNPALHTTARKIGSALGQAVAAMRDTAEPIRQRADELRSRAQELGETARDKAAELREGAAQTYNEAAEQISATASERMAQAREFARNAPDRYPLHLIAAAGILGVGIGIGLRIWREQRVYRY